MIPEVGWSRTFADPILLPNGSKLRTLRDVGYFIARLPKQVRHAGMTRGDQALMSVVEDSSDTMLPRIGIMRALHRHHKVPAPSPLRRRRDYKLRKAGKGK